jgi:hypothetical protein
VKAEAMTFTTMLAMTAGGAAALAVMHLVDRPWLRNCPRCDEPIPTLRRPASFGQLVFGGTICSSCGHEVDGMGQGKGHDHRASHGFNATV